MFYSQFGEDKLLSTYFDNDYKGVCVEVGAYDGITGSNTYHFEQKGWKTLCIEPIPESFNKCKSIRNEVINCCVSDYEKDNIDFTVIRLQDNNTSAISSLKIDERLIESHSSLINNIEKIIVNVKTLNTIFKETRFPKDIDFISIDTENTELEVLKGLDFNIYNVKFLVIENNFNESIVEEYLVTKNFKKILRNAVNDFYVNNNYLNKKIWNDYEIISANYYINEDNILGNVTDTVKLLTQKYILSNYNNLSDIISNNLFGDTFHGEPKKLYITIENKITNNKNKFIFDENEIFDFNKIFNELKKQNLECFYIDISIGEIIDKYSILELKTKYISDENKLLDIKNEMCTLDKYVKDIKDIKNPFFYKLLLHINEQIWLDTDIIKSLTITNKEYNNIYLFAEISNRIFENNQKRFRLKNYFNILENSNIKEYKSYNNNECYIDILNEEQIYKKIPEINYLCISYDIIYINYKYQITFNKLFKNPNIKFIENIESNSFYTQHLDSFSITNEEKENFDFIPIKYISGGKLGDFLNQLSVICEKYYETGRKGILYISELHPGDKFTFGVVSTYKDTYNSIYNLNYIKDYKIYDNESYDIHLSEWRENFVLSNWYYIYNNKYCVNWANHKWLTGLVENKWSNKIVINVTRHRFLSQSSFSKMFDKIKDNLCNCIFISNEKEDYDFFCNNTNLNIEFYKPINFEEVVTIVNSCKMCYLGFSSMAVIANALHKQHIMIGNEGTDFELNNIKCIIPHVLDIFI